MRVAARPHVMAGAVLPAGVVAVTPIAPRLAGPIKLPTLSIETRLSG
jgi:hypothetical protein